MNVSFGLLARVANKYNGLYKCGSLLKNVSSHNLLPKPINYSSCGIVQKFLSTRDQPTCLLNQQQRLGLNLISTRPVSYLSDLDKTFVRMRTDKKPMYRSPDPVVNSRAIVKWSLTTGDREPDMDVVKRFKRLDWGIWIRPKAGATKRIYKKKHKRVNRIRQNVFCNATQSRRLEKMVTNYWRKPRVFPDDPYEPYMRRDTFSLTKKSPRLVF